MCLFAVSPLLFKEQLAPSKRVRFLTYIRELPQRDKKEGIVPNYRIIVKQGSATHFETIKPQFKATKKAALGDLIKTFL